MTNKDWWERIYQGVEGEIPWDIGVPSEHLIRNLENVEVSVCRALDVCCGTGTEAIYLAEKGFLVSAIDISREAIRIAEEKARRADVGVGFAVGSALKIPFGRDLFGFVNDCGCFHVFPPEQRETFVMELFRVMAPDGLYLMRCFSYKEPGQRGPYRLSRKEILDVFSMLFEVISIKNTVLQGGMRSHKGYECLMRKKS
jgi:SAM-dependent methyltransferase